MNREEWNKLSEESKINLVKMWLKECDLLTHNHNLRKIEYFINCVFGEKEVNLNDTREDNSDESYLSDDGFWNYINPFNKKQKMGIDYDGFNVASIKSNWWTNKDYHKKSVWQKVNSIEELKVGDFVRVMNDYEYEFKGIISKIDYFITIHYFDEWGVGYRLIKFKDYKSIEKAVLVEE